MTWEKVTGSKPLPIALQENRRHKPLLQEQYMYSMRKHMLEDQPYSQLHASDLTLRDSGRAFQFQFRLLVRKVEPIPCKSILFEMPCRSILPEQWH